MVAMATSTLCLKLPFQRNSSRFDRQVIIVRHAEANVTFNTISAIADSTNLLGESKGPFIWSSFSFGRGLSHFPRPLHAVGSGLEATITDEKKNDISLDNVKIVVESRDDEKIHVRVDLAGEETQKAFDDVVTNLARTAPPIPGFRKMKGGKTSNVPKSFLLQILGKDRVTKFLIQEVVSTTIRDFVKKEKLTVKRQFQTTQSAEELELAFTPGSEFGFNATMEMVKSDSEETTTATDSDSGPDPS